MSPGAADGCTVGQLDPLFFCCLTGNQCGTTQKFVLMFNRRHYKTIINNCFPLETGILPWSSENPLKKLSDLVQHLCYNRRLTCMANLLVLFFHSLLLLFLLYPASNHQEGPSHTPSGPAQGSFLLKETFPTTAACSGGQAVGFRRDTLGCYGLLRLQSRLWPHGGTCEPAPPGRNWTSGGSEQFSSSASALNKA